MAPRALAKEAWSKTSTLFTAYKKDIAEARSDDLGIDAMPIFSEEYDAKHDKRVYVILSYPAYIARFSAQRVRKSHEMVLANIPCRLVFDTEHAKISPERMHEFVFIIRTCAMRVIAEMYQHKPSCVVAEGTRSSKQSMHIFFDMFFTDAPATERLARIIANRIRLDYPSAYEAEEESSDASKKRKTAVIKPCGLDFQIYAPGRTFRTVYSTGFGKEGVALLPIESHGPGRVVVPSINSTFDPVIFLKCLMHARRDEPVYVVPDAAPSEAKRARIRPETTEWTEDEIQDIITRLHASIGEKMPDVVVQETNVDGNDVCVGLKNVFCPSRGRPHAGNRTLMHVTLPPRPVINPDEWTCMLRAPSRFTCQDKDDCNNVSWRGDDWGHVLLE